MKPFNRKEQIAALHRENILTAAEALFLEKGVTSTTIDDISKAAKYSRRTIYAYFDSKEDILYHIICKGLTILRDEISEILRQNHGFMEGYWAVCHAMERYHLDSPQSADSVNIMKYGDIDVNTLPQTALDIFALGTEINELLARFIEEGQQQGVVRAAIEPMKTVYIMWSGISALLSLVQNQGTFLEQEFSTSQQAFLEYGYKQIINSILEERII